MRTKIFFEQLKKSLKDFSPIFSLLSLIIIVLFFIFEQISAADREREDRIFKLKIEANNKYPDYKHTIENLLVELNDFYTQYDKLINNYNKLENKGMDYMLENIKKIMDKEINNFKQNKTFVKKEYHVKLTDEQNKILKKDDLSLYGQVRCTVQKINVVIEKNARYDYFNRFIGNFQMLEQYTYSHNIASKVITAYTTNILQMAKNIKNNSSDILKLKIKDPNIYKKNHQKIKVLLDVVREGNKYIELELNSEEDKTRVLEFMKKVKERFSVLINAKE